jgi:hypothetical protein
MRSLSGPEELCELSYVSGPDQAGSRYRQSEYPCELYRTD